jgi:tRNA-specific 2-thiouridylase
MKVAVAMSGGVDSSVAAALLKQEGYQVIGVTMQIWDQDVDKFGGCCGNDVIDDSKKVAYQLGIPHYVINLRDTFRQKVVSNFYQEYSLGRTPNPCIRCNQHIKFDALLQEVRKLDADFIATGHYARIRYDEPTGRYLLRKGVDYCKDQSYVLYVLSQQQLKHILLPVGALTKDRVREIATNLKFPVAEKPESQDICFIKDDDYPSYLRKYIPQASQPGPILNRAGLVLGEHRGISYYTVGQRKRLGISTGDELYVVAIDPERNAVIVGCKQEVYGDELTAFAFNWIAIEASKQFIAKVKIRYRHKEAWAVITPLGEGRVHIKFAEPQEAITPGQAVVFYDSFDVIGGGIIEEIANWQ